MKKKQKPRRAPRAINHLPLSADVLRAAYDFLCATEPFCRWNLPDGESVAFRVMRNRDDTWAMHHCWGRGRARKHRISISSRHVGHTANLMATMGHEILHLHQDLTGQWTKGNDHNEAFRRDGEMISAIHGFDPKSF